MADLRALAFTKLKRYWPYVAIFAMALAVRGVTALRLAGPDTQDAEYYLMVAQSLVQGKGFMLDAIWQFLDKPQGLPHPAGGVWMPLPSLIQALGLLLGSGYRYAQIPQVLMSSFLVVFAFRLGHELSGRRSDALLSALLVLFGGGTVMARHTDVDCHVTYAVMAGMALYALFRGQASPRWLLASGLFIGLANLTRNDGVLLLIVLLLYLSWLSWRKVPYSRGAAVGAVGLYLIVMAPWWARNWLVFGRPNPVPALYPALLREYGQFFAYQPQLSWENFLSLGWRWQIEARASAAWHNFVRIAWVFQLWEVPFVAIGMWTIRRRRALYPVFAFLLLLYLALSLVYPFPSEHGTWLHSISAFVPFGAAFAAIGLRRAWEPFRRWGRTLRPAVFYAPPQCMAVLIACAWGTMIARSEIAVNQRWNAGREAIVAWVQANTAADAIIMSNDSLGITMFSGRGGVPIPYGGVSEALEVAERFAVDYLILWEYRPQGIPSELSAQAAASDRVYLLEQWQSVQIYGVDRVRLAGVRK